MLSKATRNITILFALFSFQLIGQINIDEYQSNFGNGTTVLKKKINVSFIFNETTKEYFAKVNHKYEELHLGGSEIKGLEQIGFNHSQKLNLEKARYYKIDSIGNKRLIENVKVKYADEKDYYVNNIFYSDLKVKQFNCSVDLPEDYIVSYSFSKVYKDLKFLTSLYFQDADEAVEEVEISIKKDPNVQFALFEFNLRDIKKTEDASYIRFNGKNLERFQYKSNSTGVSYFLPHLLISVSEVSYKKKTVSLLKSTDDLYAWYKSLVNELQPNKEEILKLADAIVDGEVNPSKRIEKIFQWVQNNIQYVAFENGIAGFKPTESDKVASLKYGDCKGMANLLVVLLKSQGFNAKHAWIGTRANNYSYDIPSLAVDNHMICSLEYNSQTYFLDATSKTATWDIPPAHLEGKQVMVANGESHIIYTIPISNSSQNQLVIGGDIDVSSSVPLVNLEIKASGHFYRDFKSSQTYCSYRERNSIPYYFLIPFLDGISIDKITAKEENGSVVFIVVGKYKNVAYGAKKIVFPFLDLLKYPRILENNPSVYFDYHTTIKSKIAIVNGSKFPKENYDLKTKENLPYKAVFKTNRREGKYFVEQDVTIKALYTSEEDRNSWNSFYDQVNSFNNLSITYD